MVIGDECRQCTDAATFDPDQSTTYKELSSEVINQVYGSANVFGLDVTDSVYLDKAQAFGLKEFEFLLATNAEGLEGLGGIAGYSRNIGF